MKTFKDIFKELRIANHMSQGETANKLKVSTTLISKWENGQSTPAPEMLIIIADYFDVSIDYLIGRTTDRRRYYSNENNDLRNEIYEKLGLLPIEWQKFISKTVIHMIDEAIEDNDIQ